MDDMYNIEHAGCKITIEPDQDAPDCREFDNLGKMVCFHRRYNLGDKHEYEHGDYNGWDELEEAITRKEDAAIILPLYLYDHSGLRMKVGSFQGLLQGHAEFDSGQVGFIYVTKAVLRKEYSVKRLTKKVLEQARKVLEGEVKTYDQFLSGDVYNYSVEGEDGEDVDSCCGMYGYDYCLGQAKEAAEHHAKAAKV